MPTEPLADPVQRLWQMQPKEIEAVPLEQIVAKARAFQVKMKRHRRFELTLFPFVIAVYSYAYTFPGWMVKAGSVLSAVAVVNILWLRHRRNATGHMPEAPAAALVDFHRAELVHHRDAVRKSMFREALPTLPGAILILLGPLLQMPAAETSLPLVQAIFALGATIVALVFVIVALTRGVQGYQLQQQIDELDRLRDAGAVAP